MSNIMTTPQDLNDTDAQTLWDNLNKIVQMSDRMCSTKDYSPAHEIYKLARDCRDLLSFDQVSRDTMRKLSGPPETYGGVELSEKVKGLARAGKKIDAIRELRSELGVDLLAAKTAVEAYYASTNIKAW